MCNGRRNREQRNSTCQEVAVLLETNAALREPKQSISGGGHTHRLKFAAGTHQAGICDPSYFDYLWNPQQLRVAGTNPGRPLLIITICSARVGRKRGSPGRWWPSRRVERGVDSHGFISGITGQFYRQFALT